MAKILQTPFGCKWFYQYLAASGGAITTVTCGLHYGWTSPSLIKLEDPNSEPYISSEEGSWLTVSLVFGTILGALISGFGLNRIGRRTAVLITAIPFTISWIMLAYGKSLTTLIIARIIAGVPDSVVFCALPLYLAEVSDSKIRGLSISVMNCAAGFGYIIMNNLGTYLSIKAAALISSVFSLISFIIFFFLPESPYYLITKKKFEKSKQNLRLFQGKIDIDQNFNSIRKAVEDEEIANAGSFFHLFTVPSNRKALWIVFGVRTLNQMSGSMALSFYLQSIFANLQSEIPPSGWSSIYFAIQVIFIAVNSLLVDRAGRRPLLILSTLGVSIMLLTLSIVFYLDSMKMINEHLLTVISLTALISYIISFNLGLQSGPILLAGELFPTYVKSYAVCIHELYFCALNIVASKIYYLTESSFGIHVPFFIFGIISTLGLFFVVFCVPETKGKTLEEIQNMLKGRNDDNLELQPIK